MMQLPGGILVNATLRRDFTFREFTGGLELMLNRQASPELNHVERVTQVLCNALASIGGQQVSEELVSGLSVGDRQFLMRQLAVHMDDRPVWLTAVCHHCAEKFDVSFLQSELPVKPAGKGYPSRDVIVSLGKVTVSVPTGNDQLAVSGITDNQKALRTLIARLVKIKGRRPGLKPENLTAKDIEKIENALDKLIQLSGVMFHWKETKSDLNKKKNIGLIAQEVDKILPEVVSQDAKGYLGISYSSVIPVLIEAIKEMKNEIDKLTAIIQKK